MSTSQQQTRQRWKEFLSKMQAPPTKCLPSVTTLSDCKLIRLILSDYDGTFTDPNNRISQQNADGFCLAKKLGIQIGFATGRGRESVVADLERTALAKQHHGYPGVYCSGALVFGPNGEKVFENIFPPSLQIRLLDCLKKEGFLQYAQGLTETDTYCCDFNKWTLVCHVEYHEKKPVLLQQDEFYAGRFSKLMVWNPYDKLIVLREKVETQLGDLIECAMPYEELLELCVKGCNKGTGLRALASFLGYSPDEVLVIGDSENDISMFREAGVAVAVGDAKAEAKSAAMYEALPCGEGPLLQVVKTLKEKGLCPANEG